MWTIFHATFLSDNRISGPEIRSDGRCPSRHEGSRRRTDEGNQSMFLPNFLPLLRIQTILHRVRILLESDLIFFFVICISFKVDTRFLLENHIIQLYKNRILPYYTSLF